MKAYKLTRKDRTTKTETHWGVGVSHTATGKDTKLCSNGWIHFYTNPLIAVLMNPIHANFISPILWECKTGGRHLHEPLKSGCKTLTTIKRIPLPKFTPTQKISFGILCTKEVYEDKKWNKWADDWLNDTDRSVDAAYAAASDTLDAAAAYAAYAAFAAAYAYDDAYAYAAASVSYVSKPIDFGAIAKKALTYK